MAMSETQKNEIKEEAKQILDSFAKALSSVKLDATSRKAETKGYREMTNIKKDETFRSAMFANAPKVNGEFIIAEKKKW